MKLRPVTTAIHKVHDFELKFKNDHTHHAYMYSRRLSIVMPTDFQLLVNRYAPISYKCFVETLPKGAP